MQLIASTINEAKDLQVVLSSPVVKLDDKRENFIGNFW